MNAIIPALAVVALAALAVSGPAAAAEIDVEALYQEHCAACHGVDRLGGQGPALLPDNLRRLKKAKAVEVIAEGRPATQMQGFAEVLSPAEIEALAAHVFTPAPIPSFDLARIRASHEVITDPATLAGAPVHDADPMNLFTVVEAGDHHVTILDGDRFEPIWRFPSDYALHGGAKYSPDGRFVYLASRDGWVSMHDLWTLKSVARIRVGANTRNIAVSADGKYVMAGNFLPHTLVVLDARDLSPVRVIEVTDFDGKVSSRVSAVYAAPPRDSFLVALKDLKEIWELSWDPEADPIYSNFVHSYRKGHVEGIVLHEQPFGIRRIPLEDYLDDFFFDPWYAEVIGAARNDKLGAVYNMDVRKKVAEIDLKGMPHLASGIYWQRGDRWVMATPHIREGKISVIDMESWDTVKEIETLGPGFFMRSHANTPYAWTDVFFGPDKDAMHVIDKQSLEIVKTLRPAPGKTAAHVEFTKDGRYALVSIWEMDGALVVYDAETFEEVKRIPMKKPVGKYNVYNKITYAEGTSH